MTINLTKSPITRSVTDGRITQQRLTTEWREFQEHERRHRIRAELRFDDQCRNGHETFAITGVTQYASPAGWLHCSSGCIHGEIKEHFPELAHMIKWHLVSTDGPIHYIANTCYHADGHGPTMAWVYCGKVTDPLGMYEKKETLLGYFDAAEAVKAEGVEGYRVEWDQKTAKERNLDHARSSAVWPDATDEQLCLPKPELAALLEARLPALMADFKRDMLAIGFEWPGGKVEAHS